MTPNTIPTQRATEGLLRMTDRDVDLREPLLSNEDKREQQESSSVNDVEAAVRNDGTDDDDPNSFSFAVSAEVSEMLSLGIPLAVSFFCRMGMASTDSAFVGHIHNAQHSPETYLAAAVLSDMCVNVFMVPPLAFNQVLNALVGQAVGSGNPKMAGIWLQQSMFWLSLTMLPCLVPCFFVEPLLHALDFPADVSHAAGLYAKFNVFWPIPNGLYQCMRFYFQAQGLPRPAMYNNILFLFVNALLNYVFVFGGPFPWKGLGFIGAAVSLSISRTMQSVVYFLYMFVYKQHHKGTWPGLSWKHHTTSRTLEFLYQTVPNMGTLLFQQAVSQATTMLLGRLGEGALAASSALSTVTIPWSGTLSATTWTVSSVRIGYHLGRGDGEAARRSAWLVLFFITAVNAVMAIIFLLFKTQILQIATSDEEVLQLGGVLVPAMLVGTYLNLVVSNISSGVFGGMGRPVIATILSFGLELPLSIGGVALYILVFHGELLGVYWLQAVIGGLEAIIVLWIMVASNWQYWAVEAQRRQEASSSSTLSADAAEVTTTDESSSDGSQNDDLLSPETTENEDEEAADETANLLEGQG